MRVFASATASAFSWNDDVSACSAWMRRSSTCVAWCWRWRRAFSCARSLACWRERGRRRVSDSRSLRSRSNSASRCRSSSCSRARSIVGSTSKRLPTAVVIVTSVVIDPSASAPRASGNADCVLPARLGDTEGDAGADTGGKLAAESAIVEGSERAPRQARGSGKGAASLCEWGPRENLGLRSGLAGTS